MIKHLLTVAVLSLTLVLSAFGTVSAQQTGQEVQQQVPGSTNTNPGQTGTTTNDNNTGFDWRWLLPLLAIPFIYWLVRSSTEDDRSQYRDERYAGAKGGRARRDEDREEDLI